MHLISERLYWDYRTTDPALMDMVDFSQRTSGFFKPPTSCLYSFSLYSDGQSVLWINLDGISSMNLIEIAQFLDGTDERSDPGLQRAACMCAIWFFFRLSHLLHGCKM